MLGFKWRLAFPSQWLREGARNVACAVKVVLVLSYPLAGVSSITHGGYFLSWQIESRLRSGQRGTLVKESGFYAGESDFGGTNFWQPCNDRRVLTKGRISGTSDLKMRRELDFHEFKKRIEGRMSGKVVC